jgi:hypothetical protein
MTYDVEIITKHQQQVTYSEQKHKHNNYIR